MRVFSVLLVSGFLTYVFAFVAPLPRAVRIHNKQFILSLTNETIVMAGPNVVVKGPPYIPSVQGDTICQDVVNAECTSLGTCITCMTFNMADVNHIKSLGWNTIRLGLYMIIHDYTYLYNNHIYSMYMHAYWTYI